MDIGDNAAAVLLGFVEQVEDLEEKKREFKDERKEIVTGMKGEGLPAAGILAVIAQKKADEDKAKIKRAEVSDAGALLQQTVYTEPRLAASTDLSKSQLAQDRASSIERIDAEVADLGEQIKDVLGKAKSEGFVPKLIRQLVTYRADPKKAQEASLLFDTYKTALGLT